MMLLKDILGAKKGWPTRSGSRFRPATPSPFDATLVARFEAVGLIPLGKTNVPEFGLLPLIATLVARVAFSVFAFAKQRDWTFVVITLFVLGLLLYGLLRDTWVVS